MLFDIDTRDALPIYAQLVSQVKHAIAAGVLRTGDPLPSLREVSVGLRINPLTVARAYKELETAGLVSTEHGRGTFVSAPAEALGEAYRREALATAVDRLLTESYHLRAEANDVRSAFEDGLAAYRDPSATHDEDGSTTPTQPPGESADDE